MKTIVQARERFASSAPSTEDEITNLVFQLAALRLPPEEGTAGGYLDPRLVDPAAYADMSDVEIGRRQLTEVIGLTAAEVDAVLGIHESQVDGRSADSAAE